MNMKSWVLMIILAVVSEIATKSMGENDSRFTVMCLVFAAFMYFGERTECNLKKKKENVIFGKIVKKRLIEVDMTQRELADRTGIKECYLCRILKGERNGRKYREQICEALELDFRAVLRKMAA